MHTPQGVSGKGRRSRLDAPQLTEERNCRREVELILLLELLGPPQQEKGLGVDSLLLGTGHCAGSHSPPD